jgi:DNA-binding HxlR family transcriptional regulator
MDNYINNLITINIMNKINRKETYNWGIDATLDVIGGKWKPLILYAIGKETMRFSQLLAKVQPKINQRMLTKELRELEEDGIIIRKVYPVVPPKVEYSLTKIGKSVMPILDLLCKWGYKHMDNRIKYKCD